MFARVSYCCSKNLLQSKNLAVLRKIAEMSAVTGWSGYFKITNYVKNNWGTIYKLQKYKLLLLRRFASKLSNNK